jgi:hypothetical protein
VGDLDFQSASKSGLFGAAVPSSKATYSRLWGDHRHYVSMPWSHHVLALRAAGGLNFGQNGGLSFLGGTDNPYFLNQTDLTSATSIDTRNLPLRGYAGAGGNHMGMLSAEYRLPLLSAQRGLSLWGLNLYLDRLGLVLGTDVGAAWDYPGAPDAYRPFRMEKLMWGVGAELRAQVTILGFVGTQLRMGAAQAIRPPEIWTVDGTPTYAYTAGQQVIVGFGHAF